MEFQSTQELLSNQNEINATQVMKGFLPGHTDICNFVQFNICFLKTFSFWCWLHGNVKNLLQAYLSLKLLSQTNIHKWKLLSERFEWLLTLKIDFKGQILALFTNLSTTCIKRNMWFYSSIFYPLKKKFHNQKD